jgi:transposase
MSNQSTLLNAMRECFAGLAPLEKRIKSEIIESETAHFDETGIRVEGKLKWMHWLQTNYGRIYLCIKKEDERR